MRNPFCLRSVITESLFFYGRGYLVRKLLDLVANGEYCALVGCQMGKSSLFAYLADRKVQAAHFVDPERILAARIDFGGQQPWSQGLWIEILRALALAAKHTEVRRFPDGP
ncbi:MAG: hypothetical protein GY835_09515 [bacterium]|nr:hypothetical protein [bacterium]